MLRSSLSTCRGFLWSLRRSISCSLIDARFHPARNYLYFLRSSNRFACRAPLPRDSFPLTRRINSSRFSDHSTYHRHERIYSPGHERIPNEKLWSNSNRSPSPSSLLLPVVRIHFSSFLRRKNFSLRLSLLLTHLHPSADYYAIGRPSSITKRGLLRALRLLFISVAKYPSDVRDRV